jgi:hypothetical protein
MMIDFLFAVDVVAYWIHPHLPKRIVDGYCYVVVVVVVVVVVWVVEVSSSHQRIRPGYYGTIAASDLTSSTNKLQLLSVSSYQSDCLHRTKVDCLWQERYLLSCVGHNLFAAKGSNVSYTPHIFLFEILYCPKTSIHTHIRSLNNHLPRLNVVGCCCCPVTREVMMQRYFTLFHVVFWTVMEVTHGWTTVTTTTTGSSSADVGAQVAPIRTPTWWSVLVPSSSSWTRNHVTSKSRSQQQIHHHHRYSLLSTQRYFHLTSAIEEERITNVPDDDDDDDNNSSGEQIQWLDLQQFSNPTLTSTKLQDIMDDVDRSSWIETMPLYPIPAVHVPDRANMDCTLWNMERRNIQMALDLELDISLSSNNASVVDATAAMTQGLFCLVLQAKDTGRIVNVGTIVRLLHMRKEPKYDVPAVDLTGSNNDSSHYRRVILTCTPVAIADILQIENPYAAGTEYRYRHPNEYLMATVQYRKEINIHDSPRLKTDAALSMEQSLCCQIQENFNRVRSLYFDTKIATQDWPPQMVSKLQSGNDTLPCIITSPTLLLSPVTFWSMAQSWQSLCDTIRTAHEMILVSNRNEYMVDAAIRQGGGGGPLQLPVHVEDLRRIEDRRCVLELERTAQQQWLDMQLDPCIDFQMLLTLRHHGDRLHYFSKMVERECCRLEDLASQERRNTETDSRQLKDDDCNNQVKNNPIQKGAWFNDDYW